MSKVSLVALILLTAKTAATSLGWCMPTDFKGVIAAKEVLSMSLAVDVDPVNQGTLYAVGGLVRVDQDEEAFLYTLADDRSLGECGLRHSFRFSALDLGIQAVSISSTKVWAVALSTGNTSSGIGDTTNVLIRVAKADSNAELDVYRVDLKGTEAGQNAGRQTVLKMISFSDDQVVLQSRSELRFIDVVANRARGLFTYDQGDVFIQRDMFAVTNTDSQQSNLYISYSRLDYIKNKLYFVVDRVSVDQSSLSIGTPENIFLGLSQVNGDRREYLTVRMAVSDQAQRMAVCAQRIQTNDLSQTLTRNLFLIIDYSIAGKASVSLKGVDQPFGFNIECAAASIDSAGQTAYFLLDENDSHVTTLVRQDMETGEIYRYQGLTLPYEAKNFVSRYSGQRAVFSSGSNFVEVNIDGSLYGLDAPANLQIGYLVDSNAKSRVNPLVSTDGTLSTFRLQYEFTANAFPRSFFQVDTDLESQGSPVRQSSFTSFGTTTKDVSLKQPWIDHYCPQSGQLATSENAKIELQYSFAYAFRGVSSMSDVQKTCFPRLFLDLKDPVKESNIVSDFSEIPESLSARVLLKELTELDEAVVINGGAVSDAYELDSTLKDDKYLNTLYARVIEPTSNTLPVFATPLADLTVQAEIAFTYTLPDVIDPEIPDQTTTVTLDAPDGNDWLKVSLDSKQLYTEAGQSTAFKMGVYMFTVRLNDGYFFGPNETQLPLKVTIVPKPNALPYFDPPLEPLQFGLSKPFRYNLPTTVDADGDSVSISVDNANAPWLLHWLSQKALMVLENSTNDPNMLGDYEIFVTLEDNSKYGQPRTQTFNLTVSIMSPDQPTMPGLQTEFIIEVETAWSYTLPPITNLDKNQVIVRLIDTYLLPWLQLDDLNKVLSIDASAAIGNDTLGSYPFKVELEFSNEFASSALEYTITIDIVQPPNRTPQFVGVDELYPPGTTLTFIAKDLFSYSLPDIIDPDGSIPAGVEFRVTVDNTDCPWLTYNSSLKSLYVEAETTTNDNVGKYTFKVLVSDFFPYGINYSIYEGDITVNLANNLPYFEPALPGTITFTVLEAFEYVLPTVTDDDREPVIMTVDLKGLAWLQYSELRKTLTVREGATGEQESNTHHFITIVLRDTYTLGVNSIEFTLKIWIKPPDKPFFVLNPTNTGPVFVTDLPAAPVSFNVTDEWEYFLPDIYDFDKDQVLIKASGTGVEYIKADSGPARLVIAAGQTTEAEIGIKTVQIDISDIPVDLAKPITTSYSMKVIGVDAPLYERYARLTKPPLQEGSVPQARLTMNQQGLVTISFDSSLKWRTGMLEQINKFAEPIVITVGSPFITKPNEYGFIDVPYLKLIIFSTSPAALKDLAHTWSVTKITDSSIEIQIEFTDPLKVSITDDIDELQVEFHIQEFLDESGLGVQDGFLLTKQLPRQSINDDTAAQIAETGQQVKEASESVMYVQIGVNLFLNQAMSQMWIMVNGLQFIVALPLIPVTYPAQTSSFLGRLIDVATFDLIPTDLIYPYIFDYQESVSFNANFEAVGFDSGYLAENMGTVFVMTHVFILCYLLVLLFMLLRRTCNCAQRFSNYLNRIFLWNMIIIFTMEAYIEIGLNAMAVIKRWSYDSEGSYNDKSNHVYAVCYLVAISIYPFFLAFIYIYNRKFVDRKSFLKRFGGPFEGLKKLHLFRAFFFFFFYIFRRWVVVLFITINEGEIYWTWISFFVTTEFQMMFILSEKPFYEPFRNRLELFNEAVLLMLITATLCFTEVMEPEGHQTIGWFIIGLTIAYLIVHLIALSFDSLRKLCLLVWLQLAKFKGGRRFQNRIKRRATLVRKFLRRRTTILQTQNSLVMEPMVSVESSSEAPSSRIHTPDSSLSLNEIEDIINRYETSRPVAAMPEAEAGSQTTERDDDIKQDSTKRIAKSLFLIQRNHQIPDHEDKEMRFWMAEIERFEQEDQQDRVERGLSPLRKPEARPANRNELLDHQQQDEQEQSGEIFIPDTWLDKENDDQNQDDAFEGQVIEVIDLAVFDPVQVKRRPKQMKKKGDVVEKSVQLASQVSLDDLEDMQPQPDSLEGNAMAGYEAGFEAGFVEVEDDIQGPQQVDIEQPEAFSARSVTDQLLNHA